jgi:iron complex transport system permease protein
MMTKKVIAFTLVAALLLILFVAAVCMGSLAVSPISLFNGLFVSYDATVSTVFDLRFPRICIALLAGASMAVSGVLLQSVMKNPIADPGIIGISGGAAFVAILITTFAPALLFAKPVFALIGGLVAFILVYGLAWKSNLNPLHIILVGVAIQAMFAGLSSAFSSMTGGNVQGAAAIVNGSITLKTWSDVTALLGCTVVGLAAAFVAAQRCNLLALEETKLRSLGINVNATRLAVSFVAVLLAASATAIVGIVGFLGLIAPHIGRLLVGTNHKVLIPFSVLLGAFILLLADTIGRTIAAPYELSAAVLMAIIGGPFFIILLRRKGVAYGS